MATQVIEDLKGMVLKERKDKDRERWEQISELANSRHNQEISY